MWQRLFAIVIASVAIAALPVVVFMALLMKGISSLVSPTYWTANESLIYRVGIGILLAVVAIVAVAVDYVRHPDEWK